MRRGYANRACKAFLSCVAEYIVGEELSCECWIEAAVQDDLSQRRARKES